MLNYNSNNIFVGYIKQLLHTFNLPTVRVYKEGMSVFKDNHYIYKDDFVVCLEDITDGSATDSSFKKLFPYNFGKPITNFSTTLNIDNIIYDSYTHIYLGKYLRFIRDYKHLDLMSLYNCFSNELVKDLKIPGFDSSDTKYKIYMIPVKLFQNYTIAIDSDLPVEFICGFYDSKQIITTHDTNIQLQTYFKSNVNKFNSPYLYSKLNNIAVNLKEIESNLDNFKLFIKIPATNTSSIVILEGNYTSNNDFTLGAIKELVKYNNSVNNYKIDSITGYNLPTETEDGGKVLEPITAPIDNPHLNEIKLISKLQLLKINSKSNHPFADRLIEYLIDNAITSIDNISNNIKRLQKSLKARYDKITLVAGEEKHNLKGLKEIQRYGIWEDKYKNIIYDASVQESMLNNEYFDLLGYGDKDIENIFISKAIEDEVYSNEEDV